MASVNSTRHLLLTGVPGSGKTTAIRTVAAHLDRPLAGFYTEEMRTNRERRGFRLVRFDGGSVVIAHIAFPKTRSVGKYGVDVDAIDGAVENVLKHDSAGLVYLIDEIGKMECLSTAFVTRMRRLLDGEEPVVATIALHGDGFIAEVKRRVDCELWTLDRGNRDAMPGRIMDWFARGSP